MTAQHLDHRRVAGTNRMMIIGGLLAVVIVGAMVLQVTQAAFTDRTTNPGNQWGAGEVTITDDQNGVALFSADDVAPGYSETNDIAVSNESSIDSEAAFYTEAFEGEALGDYLTVEITAGSETLFDGTLSELASAHTGWDDAIAEQAPATDEATTYVLTVAFPEGQDGQDDVQGAASSIDLVWEARSTS